MGMETRYLIDALMRQTTVLIAQISTATGTRAPLAHVADQVFLDLSHELETQGLCRKVAADMFGLALRSYQKKTARLEETQNQHQRTIWQSVLDLVAQRTRISRRELLTRFHLDGEREVIGVLGDLVASGILYTTGRGDETVYGFTSDGDRRVLSKEAHNASLQNAVWLLVYQLGPIGRSALKGRITAPDLQVEESLAALVEQGVVRREGVGDAALFSAEQFGIPLGSGAGWEVAVFDHFRAVTKAIAAKINRGTNAQREDTTGGGTVSFDLHADHPQRELVLSLLGEVREKADAALRLVQEHNRAHQPENNRRVTFYFGQYDEERSP
jgi:hypothetical protein